MRDAMSDTTHDAVILGGGLAGLCLALQLRGEFPDMDIVVLERRAHPLPVAAHKVGESTVEIAAHYLAETLGLREHLETEHIRKFGFRFFFSDGRERSGRGHRTGREQGVADPELPARPRHPGEFPRRARRAAAASTSVMA